MATLRKTQVPSTPSSDALDLALVLDGPRPGPEHPDRDRVWRDLRREIGAMLVGGDYDPRRLAGLGEVAAATWFEARHDFLARHFHGDPRVAVDA